MSGDHSKPLQKCCMAPKGVAESGLGWDASTKVTPMPIPSRGGGSGICSAALGQILVHNKEWRTHGQR